MRFLYPVLLLLVSCQANPDAALPTVTAIQNGQITLADGSTRPIPHYGDPAYTVFYLVRHCEKVLDGSPDPPLTPLGQARAERLGQIMDKARLDRICTTNTKRTIATGVVVQYWAGGPPTETFPVAAQADWLSETLAHAAGKNLFYVGHTNTVPQLLNQLTGKQQYSDIPDDVFDRFYIAVTRGIGDTEVLAFKY